MDGEVIMNKQVVEKREIAPHFLHGTLNPELIKQIKKGGQTLNYVAGPDIIAMLHAVYRDKWDFEVIDTRRDDLLDLDILFTVTGKMTVSNLATRTMNASTTFVDNCVKTGGKGIRLSEIDPKHIIYTSIPDLFKIATTDCMKKLASWFRVAECVYGFEGKPLFIDSPAILTDRQKTALAELSEKLGGKDNLKVILWKWDPRIRNLMGLDSTNTDEFIAFANTDLFIEQNYGGK